jgi:DNA invertase Pin-like site-specific DNA recombinase
MRTVLGGLEELERELIRSRITEGPERAIAEGTVMGRKPKSRHQRQEAEAFVDIGRFYNVSRSTISRLKPRRLSECGELRAAWLSCRRRTRYPDQRIHQHG